MTVSELLKNGERILSEAGTDNSANEARWILENDLNMRGGDVYLNAGKDVPGEKASLYIEKIRKRASGVPVQYLLGVWDFFSREFFVGEGVLIPRPETEQLAEYALGCIRDTVHPVVIDLCAGSGCIGLTIAAERPDSRVYLVEKYDGAFAYLEKNINKLACSNATAVKADVLEPLPDLPKADLVVSNPPYIRSGEIPFLQKEVLAEPREALDGGTDGLEFYRAIAGYLPDICKGKAVFECGEDQARELSRIFPGAEIIRDFSSIERIVVTEVLKR